MGQSCGNLVEQSCGNLVETKLWEPRRNVGAKLWEPSGTLWNKVVGIGNFGNLAGTLQEPWEPCGNLAGTLWGKVVGTLWNKTCGNLVRTLEQSCGNLGGNLVEQSCGNLAGTLPRGNLAGTLWGKVVGTLRNKVAGTLWNKTVGTLWERWSKAVGTLGEPCGTKLWEPWEPCRNLAGTLGTLWEPGGNLGTLWEPCGNLGECLWELLRLAPKPLLWLKTPKHAAVGEKTRVDGQRLHRPLPLLPSLSHCPSTFTHIHPCNGRAFTRGRAAGSPLVVVRLLLRSGRRQGVPGVHMRVRESNTVSRQSSLSSFSSGIPDLGGFPVASPGTGLRNQHVTNEFFCWSNLVLNAEPKEVETLPDRRVPPFPRHERLVQ